MMHPAKRRTIRSLDLNAICSIGQPYESIMVALVVRIGAGTFAGLKGIIGICKSLTGTYSQAVLYSKVVPLMEIDKMR